MLWQKSRCKTAEDKGHNLVHLAIAWTLVNPAVTSWTVGAKTPEQIIHNAEAASWILTPEELDETDQIQGAFRILSLHH